MLRSGANAIGFPGIVLRKANHGQYCSVESIWPIIFLRSVSRQKVFALCLPFLRYPRQRVPRGIFLAGSRVWAGKCSRKWCRCVSRIPGRIWFHLLFGRAWNKGKIFHTVTPKKQSRKHLIQNIFKGAFLRYCLLLLLLVLSPAEDVGVILLEPSDPDESCECPGQLVAMEHPKVSHPQGKFPPGANSWEKRRTGVLISWKSQMLEVAFNVPHMPQVARARTIPTWHFTT